MKTYLPKIVLFLAMMFLMFACTVNRLPDNDRPGRHAWIKAWLHDPICHPPCWEKITPGHTSMSEASRLLRQLAAVEVTYESKSGIDWAIEKTDYGTVYPTDDNLTVSAIAIDIRQELRISEVVEKYGFPSYAEIPRCDMGSCVAYLIYPDDGMRIETFLPYAGKFGQVDIQPDDLVRHVLFFPSGLENYKKMPTSDEIVLMKWKGYAIYP